ncbi:hypothetical protein [Streptomyces sp. NPDC096934]|uniref:hypothetical protein n=1 Tax=unclassified Streptomyces TaxID=2593676 RepID=UPI0033285144
MAASAHLLLSALSKRPTEPAADPCLSVEPRISVEPRFCLFTAEGTAAEAPLTSEPPLPDAEPLTSEPPLADAAHLTSEPISTGAATDASGV